MSTRIYKTPFAATGDKEPLATDDQPDGKVSLQAGWTPDYELPNDNANYRPVGRLEMNGVLNELTQGLGEVQLNGFAKWQAIDGGWPLGAWVSHNGILYLSTAENNTENPDTGAPGWINPLAGRLLRTTVYTLSGSTVMKSVDGGTAIADNKFTSHPQMSYRVVEACGGGGAGGGAFQTTETSVSTASGGGSAAYIKGTFSTVLTDAVITIGAGGNPVPGAKGGNGSTTALGTEVTCPGGGGGPTATQATGVTSYGGSTQSTAAPAPIGGNIISSRGNRGGNGNMFNAFVTPSQGAPGPWGGAGANGVSADGAAACAGTAPGAGGGGVGNNVSQPNFEGGRGGDGILIIEERA